MCTVTFIHRLLLCQMSFFSDDLALDLLLKRLSAREIRMIGSVSRSTRELAQDGCVLLPHCPHIQCITMKNSQVWEGSCGVAVLMLGS